MSSYSGANTSQDQQDKRRAMKQKQRVGSKKGFKSHTSAAEKIRMPRVVNATFAGATQAALEQRIADRPELPITTGFFKKMLKRGESIEFQVKDENFATMDGEVFTVNSEKIDTPIYVHTVRVWIGLGHGIEIKKLPSGRVIVE